MIVYSTKITRALLCTVHGSQFNTMYRSTEYLEGFSHQSLYGISCPLVARRTNTLLTTFVVNVHDCSQFFHSHGILTLNVVRLSRALQRFSSSCLLYLFIYMVALNTTISSELLHARSLIRSRIPELFKWCHPSANTLKLFLAHPYNYAIFLHETFFFWNIFSSNIFEFTVQGRAVCRLYM